ncbi:uncharacterized protein Z520_06934 [Fonsecaea multimorphosa CBS 102226]|uniref:Carboxylesterase family protein n=1 Tax=Fonsecaea multimorphosa CBS 102226 TaxID=1442371 RepID=A0A0D2JVJ3_9EURO|nr:uncharacterized protein Z520_06934 [Fonsecaea multimorphosa CBS 102226]KIX97482.1 hypothetical protein Z520_06934 [Fonsecaea multimorphosa CBS 102226]OAL23444.1 hypothetical protein AYO22_06494 [Fonsecaea multimorphosa]
MRMTRAALRAQAQEEPQLIYEDADANSNNSLQDDCADAADANQDPDRPPLKDITTEINPSTTEDPFTDEQTEPMQKAKSRKKGQRTKHDKAQSDEPQEQGPQPEDASQGHHSESSEGKGSIHDTPSTASIDQGAVRDNEVTVEAVDATLKEQGISDSSSAPQHSHTGPPKTPKFDPSVHKTMDAVTSSASDSVEDSFVEKITSRTPGRLQILLEETKSSDSFAEQISSRTPRIEDSVEAIDALEDAIEKISETLPALDELKIESPVKLQKNTPARLNLQPTTPPTDPQKRVPGQQPAQPSRCPPPKTGKTSASLERSKLSAGRESSTNPSARATTPVKLAKRPIIDGHKSRESSSQGAAPPLSFSNSPVKNHPNTKKQVAKRALSTSKPGFVPSKSTKSPTKPTFTLPGDAVAAKLKAQREERMKREEEVSNEKKAFKARPVPAKISRPSVVPRENKASQARLSIYATGRNKENVAPKPATATQPQPRPSSLGPKPKTSETTNVKASVRRTTTSATPTKPRASIIHLANGQKSTVTKEDVSQQKAKGKEVFARSKAETERVEKERREKEEAARKARAEAAERGRQASREWAEKQKKKIAAKILAAKEKEKAGGAENMAARGQTNAVVSN